MQIKSDVPAVKGFSPDARKKVEEWLQFKRLDNEKAITKRAARVEPDLSAESYEFWLCGQEYMGKLLKEQAERIERLNENYPPVFSCVITFILAASGLITIFHALPVPIMTPEIQLLVLLFALVFAFSLIFGCGAIWEVIDNRKLKQHFTETGFMDDIWRTDFLSNTSTIYLFGEKALFVEGQQYYEKFSKTIFYEAVGDVEQCLEDGYVAVNVFGKDGELLVKIFDPVAETDGGLAAFDFIKRLRSKCGMSVCLQNVCGKDQGPNCITP